MAAKKTAYKDPNPIGRSTGATKVPAYARRAAMRFTTSNS